MAEWVKVYPNALSDEYCDNVVAFFNEQNKGLINAPWRRCYEYTAFDTSPFCEEFKRDIKKVYERYKLETGSGPLAGVNTLESPNVFQYNVDKTEPFHYHRHADNWNFATSTRQVSIIAYLNDVQEGGATDFGDLGVRVMPRKGCVLIFPSFYTYMHLGEPPISGSKYIIVSWIHYDGELHAYRTSPL